MQMHVRGPEVPLARSFGPVGNITAAAGQFEGRGEAGRAVDPRRIMELVTSDRLTRLEQPRVAPARPRR